jgi:hypothetical protein
MEKNKAKTKKARIPPAPFKDEFRRKKSEEEKTKEAVAQGMIRYF